jgi:hypothetical protein
MKPEFPTIDQDKMVSPHAQEVEYALLLSRMINTVKEDPSQLRMTIYEFARARLKIDTSWVEEAERERLSAALETAIQGLNSFRLAATRRNAFNLQPQLRKLGMAPPSRPSRRRRRWWWSIRSTPCLKVLF